MGMVRLASESECRQYEVQLPGFFRLDLTVSALRRLPANVVDVWTAEHRYVRVFDEPDGPKIVSVEQSGARKLRVTIEGRVGDEPRPLERVRRMLGLGCDLTAFNRAAERIRWLRHLAIRMRGVKPPRYPTLWEALVNAIAFQQVSLHAASAIVGRMITSLQRPLCHRDVTLYAFPGIEQVLGTDEMVLRHAGLSGRKIETLRRVGEAIASGALTESMLEERSTSECIAFLSTIKGVGPWSATVAVLRGLGRLDLFPHNDTSVVRNLVLVAGTTHVDLPRALAMLRPQQGMLYYHLLLARLEKRGELSTSSDG